MSSATVATIACLALVVAVATTVWVVVAHRRTDALARSLTARKWDIVTLRAELGAVRRRIQDEDVNGEADGDGDASGNADGEPGPRHSAGRPRTPAGPSPSPTAWRRDRARTASSRPRRRRPF